MTELAFRPELAARRASCSPFIRGQRWFGAKRATSWVCGSSTVRAARARRRVLVDALVEVRYGAGTHDVYQLIVGVREEGGVRGRRDRRGGRPHELRGVRRPRFARELVDRLRAGATRRRRRRDARVLRDARAAVRGPRRRSSARALGVEQSNTSIVVDDELIVKIYRRVEAGVNPELELLLFFAEHGFEHVPKLGGWWSYAGPLLNATLGVVQEFVRRRRRRLDARARGARLGPETFLRRLAPARRGDRRDARRARVRAATIRRSRPRRRARSRWRC